MEHGDRLQLSIERWGRKVTIQVKHGKIQRLGDHKVVIEYPEAASRKPKTKKVARTKSASKSKAAGQKALSRIGKVGSEEMREALDRAKHRESEEMKD
jgi:hypothetical protein